MTLFTIMCGLIFAQSVIIACLVGKIRRQDVMIKYLADDVALDHLTQAMEVVRGGLLGKTNNGVGHSGRIIPNYSIIEGFTISSSETGI